MEVVATAEDVPGERWYGLLHNDWPVFVAEGEETRYVGDVLAAVAADDRATARAAAELVDVTYEVLPATLDALQAMKPGARQVNPQHDNVLVAHSKISRGDVDAALARPAHVVSGTWQTQRIEHLFLEPESGLPSAAGRRPAAPADAGPGHLRRPPAGRARAGRCPSDKSLRRTGAQRRRLRRQGRHDDPGADGAAGAA